MEEVEEILKRINRHKEQFHFSLDIYYNDIDDTFVVKLSGFGDGLADVKHFRNQRLRDSLFDAYDFLNR